LFLGQISFVHLMFRLPRSWYRIFSVRIRDDVGCVEECSYLLKNTLLLELLYVPTWTKKAAFMLHDLVEFVQRALRICWPWYTPHTQRVYHHSTRVLLRNGYVVLIILCHHESVFFLFEVPSATDVKDGEPVSSRWRNPSWSRWGMHLSMQLVSYVLEPAIWGGHEIPRVRMWSPQKQCKCATPTLHVHPCSFLALATGRGSPWDLQQHVPQQGQGRENLFFCLLLGRMGAALGLQEVEGEILLLMNWWEKIVCITVMTVNRKRQVNELIHERK